jgi:putative ABC transport system permease protein
MIANHLKLAFRNLIKRKFISFTNVIGLSTGMAVCILISMWIWDEISFDRYHTNYESIAKVRLNVTGSGGISTTKTVPLPLVHELATNFSNDFRRIVPSSHKAHHILGYNQTRLFRKGVYLGNQAPAMFSFKMIRGDLLALKDQRSIILRESTSKALFGDLDPLNKVVTLDNMENVKVTGVYEDLPENTSFADVEFICPFDLYLSTETWLINMRDQWSRAPVQLYVQIAGNTNFNRVGDRIRSIVQNKASEDDPGRKTEVLLEPMSKWHLYTYKDGMNNTGSIRYVKLFAWIGVFVLLLACFNFMNLSTARSEKKAMEVGVRKAVGSLRSQLVGQFLTESVFLSLVAFAVSIIIVLFALPFFNEVTGKDIGISRTSFYFWMAALLCSVLTGLLAGSYPAFYLSSFLPVKVLKGSFRLGGSPATLRKLLVVFQFSVSVVLIICTIVVFRQIEHTRQRPPGYNPDNLIIVQMIGQHFSLHFEAVKADLLNEGSIISMATSESTTTDIWGTENDLYWKGKDPNTSVDLPRTDVSVDYGKTVGWNFVEGRDFSVKFPSDSAAFILNESAVNFMGLQHPVGEIIQWRGSPFTVVGVIKDMIVESPYDPVKPSIYSLRGQDNFVILKLSPAMKPNKAVAGIESVFKKYYPSAPFQYEFVNDKYDRKFDAEEQVGKLSGFFTVLAVFISCLGIFAMATFMAAQRSREISIRKVFGASVYSVWKLLSKEFAALIIFSLIIAIPLSYYFMHNWLENYYYRTTIAWWIPCFAAVAALLVTLITVSFQTIKAALSNPVKILRDE